jgi:ATP-dependent helicase HrpB
VQLAKESAVRDATLFLALDVEAGSGAHSLVRMAAKIDEDDLRATAPHLLRTEERAELDPARGAMVGVRRRLYADLVLDERQGIAVPPDVVSAGLARAFADDFARLFKPDEKVAGLRARMRFAARVLPNDGFPSVDDDDLKALLPDLAHGKRTLEELGRASFAEAMRNLLTWQQRTLLDEEVPERIEVPSGSQVVIDYEPALHEGGAPVLAVRLQELFGLTETPRVARGRVPLVLHLLSPNRMPVQVTLDLKSFWANTYPEVRKELRSRYPKHSWPDDPLTAPPEARPRRRR